MAEPPQDTSGVLVYPRAPVPRQRESDPAVGTRGPSDGGGGRKRTLLIGAIAVVVGAIAGFIVKPSHADEVADARAKADAAAKAADSEKGRADGIAKQLAAVMKAKEDADTKIEQLANKAADAEKRASELAAAEKRLAGTIDSSQGSVSTEGDEIHLKLVDKVLFAVGDDQLTDKGKAVLDKVAAALKEIPDKQVWVQGHTDDQPIFVPPPKKDAAASAKDAKDAKGKKAGKATAPDPKAAATTAPAPVRFITNWELSAARALQVVHYLQDTGKIDPTRLAALAFGQYHPVSKSNKALNRRIEIVLYPKPKLTAEK